MRSTFTGRLHPVCIFFFVCVSPYSDVLFGTVFPLTYSSVTHCGITEVCCAQQSARLYTAALRQYS